MMPAVYDSLKARGLSSGKAWRVSAPFGCSSNFVFTSLLQQVSFIVPTILLLLCAAGSFFLCEDTPTGKWEDRFNTPTSTVTENELHETATPTESIKEKSSFGKEETQITVQVLEEGHGEGSAQPVLKMEEVKRPSLKDSLKAVVCMQTLMLAAPYACSFGGKRLISKELTTFLY
jgi:NNP family nitrate/nitrite transporter-like MFS transporter